LIASVKAASGTSPCRTSNKPQKRKVEKYQGGALFLLIIRFPQDFFEEK
jgi:hypothetical protein